jgi:hypothetical protein
VSLRFVSEKRAEQGIKEIIVGPFEQKKQAEEADDVTVYYSTPFGDTKDGKQKAIFARTRRCTVLSCFLQQGVDERVF